jgi:uncharacterized membrane protein YgdD (TMEM256/DUF423 family)
VIPTAKVPHHSSAQKILALGALFLAAGIGFGAFGAHGLRNILDGYGREIYEKAVFYHLIDALGLLIVGLLVHLELVTTRAGKLSATLLTAGILFFSGSLYLYAITRITLFAMITPLGGLALIFGWGLLAVGIFRRDSI